MLEPCLSILTFYSSWTKSFINTFKDPSINKKASYIINLSLKIYKDFHQNEGWAKWWCCLKFVLFESAYSEVGRGSTSSLWSPQGQTPVTPAGAFQQTNSFCSLHWSLKCTWSLSGVQASPHDLHSSSTHKMAKKNMVLKVIGALFACQYYVSFKRVFLCLWGEDLFRILFLMYRLNKFLVI